MIGIGFDIHRLVKKRALFIGGVKIKHKKGLLGHSDGDVLLHAICDGMLGAAGLGDIGDMFPDTNPKYKGYKSADFIKKVMVKLKAKGLKAAWVDTIIFAEEPKLVRIKPRIKKSVSRLLKVSLKKVNIKAKTMEKLGPIGAKKAIAAFSLVGLARN